MNLDRIIPKAPEENLVGREAMESLQSAIQQVRTISHLLHPPLLDEVGLESALRWYLEGLTSRSGIAVSFSASPSPFPRLPSTFETAIFRIVQEATTNVYRHSEATEAAVTLEYDGHNLVVQIRDNGKGLREDIVDMRSAAVGIGIGGMKQRIEELGGTLRLENTDPGALIGATIPFSFPATTTEKKGSSAA
jgi:signal transduction histidine kinase